MTEFAGGVQYHHSRSLSKAGVPGVNLVQYLAGVTERTLNAIDEELEARARQLVLDVEARAQACEADLDHLRQSDPLLYEECATGLKPWPDEPGVAETFTPICHCQRRCLFHDSQAPWSSPEDCNCKDPCPRHGEKVVDHEVGPLPKPDPRINPRHYTPRDHTGHGHR